MSIKRLNIEQQFAEIGVRSTPAKLNISMPRMQMRIKTETPQMHIDRKAPSFKVNRQKSRNTTTHKALLESVKTQYNKNRQASPRGNVNANDDGTLPAKKNTKGDKTVQTLINNRVKQSQTKIDLNKNSTLTGSPDVTWDKGYMRINWSSHSLVIDWDGEYMPEMVVDPKYSIEVYLRTQPYFRVMVEEIPGAETLGRYIDRAI